MGARRQLAQLSNSSICGVAHGFGAVTGTPGCCDTAPRPGELHLKRKDPLTRRILHPLFRDCPHGLSPSNN